MRHLPLVACLAASLFTACATGTTRIGAPPVPAPAAVGPLVWIEDAPERAFEVAQASGRLVFVDTWAPWCHSCLALKAEVLEDPALRVHADAFVWLSLDVERPSAASFLTRYPQQAYPTLWVLRPDGRPLMRWVGTLTAPQLVTLLDDARLALAGSAGEASGDGAANPTVRMLEAEAAAAEGRFEEAIAGWTEALAAAPPDWSRRSRVATALLFVRMRRGELADGLALALREVPLALAAGAGEGAGGRADLVIGGLDCATSLPAEDPRRGEALRALLPYAEALRDDARLLADDRSGVHGALVGAWEALGEAAKRSEANAQWIAFLEATRAAAPDAEARAVYDAHLMTAYLNAGRGEDALVMLATSERDQPGDYNPLARKAHVLLTLGRLPEARAHAERALALAYGPRRARIHVTLARVLEGLGEVSAARATLTEAITGIEALPAAQRSERTLGDLRRMLAALPAASGG